MQREDLDQIGKIIEISVQPRRDGKMVAYFECDKKDVAFLNRVFKEVNTVIDIRESEDEYSIQFTFPYLHYKKDLFIYRKDDESEDFRRLRMNEFEFITAAFLDEFKHLISYPEHHAVYLHPNQNS